MRGSARGVDLFSLLLLASSIRLSRSDDVEKESNVMVLTGANFDQALKQHKRMLVEFYAPWCHHCKDLEPEYEEAASIVKRSRLRTVIAKIDAYKEKQIGQKYAKGYPTILYFEKGVQTDVFEEERKATPIVDWLFSKEYPIFQEIKEDEIIEFFEDSHQGDFVLVARVKKDSPRQKAFKKAAEKHLAAYVGFKCAYVLLPQTADAKADATLTMWRAGFKEPDPSQIEFTGTWTGEQIALWARNATYQVIGNSFSPSKYGSDALARLGLDAAVVALVDQDDALKTALLQILRPLAHVYSKWRITIAEISSLSDEDLQTLGAKKSHKPQITILKSEKKYVLDSPEKLGDAEAVKKFFIDVKAGKASPRWKSAPAPVKLVDKDGVTELTGSTFEEYILDSKKDVLVMFHAPWCAYCKEEAVEWAKVGRDVQKAGWRERGVIIAKMDGTENDSLENVTTFPRLWFYPAVKAPLKSKVELAPDTAHEELMDFLLDNARNLDDDDALGGKSTKKKKQTMIDREMAKKQKGKKKTPDEL